MTRKTDGELRRERDEEYDIATTCNQCEHFNPMGTTYRRQSRTVVKDDTPTYCKLGHSSQHAVQPVVACGQVVVLTDPRCKYHTAYNDKPQPPHITSATKAFWTPMQLAIDLFKPFLYKSKPKDDIKKEVTDEEMEGMWH